MKKNISSGCTRMNESCQILHNYNNVKGLKNFPGNFDSNSDHDVIPVFL